MNDGCGEDSCGYYEIHRDRIAVAVESLPPQDTISGLSDFFKVLGDETRMRILLSLEGGEMCVCDISEALGMTMSAVSHQLRVLRDANLVKNRREGRVMYYRLCDDHVRTIIETAIEHVVE